jgi:purine nucleosidase
MIETRTFLIDTDTASDDAVALIMALRHPQIRVAAITTVAGNVDAETATRNALFTVELCGSNVPVYCGSRKPLRRDLQTAEWYHGADGLGDHGYKTSLEPKKNDAIDAFIDVIEKNPGLTLVTLGPLTNFATALERQPKIVTNIGRCVVMGGAPCCEGNVTPAAEYNFWVDPEAARAVVRSGCKLELVGWQLSRGEAALKPVDIDAVLRLNTPQARFAIECNSTAQQAYFDQTGDQGIALADPVAMSIAIDPKIGTSWSQHYVDVEVTSGLTRGTSVVDKLNVAGDGRNRKVWAPLLSGQPNTRVYWTIDVSEWKSLLYSSLR